MSVSRIAPNPVLTAALAAQLQFDCTVRFSSAGPNPGARGEWGRQFTLGHDSDWDAVVHDLEVHCDLAAICGASFLFGPAGITPRSATLALALEWVSPESGWRMLGQPHLVRMPQAGDMSGPVSLSLQLPPDSLRGTGMLSVLLLLHDPGMPDADETALARTPGFRFGTLGPGTQIIIDGDGSLFPVVEENAGADAPLWQLAKDWTDPLEDEFSSACLSLTLNRDHPDFPHLQESTAGSWTPLFCQVIASWITIFLLELKLDLNAEFADIASGRIGTAQRGSIAHAAASMVAYGALDCSSPVSLAHSVQQWVSTAIRQQPENQ